jgi:hypothetical protein
LVDQTALEIRVLRLVPCPGPSAHVAGADPLRHDAFEVHPARIAKDGSPASSDRLGNSLWRSRDRRKTALAFRGDWSLKSFHGSRRVSVNFEAPSELAAMLIAGMPNGQPMHPLKSPRPEVSRRDVRLPAAGYLARGYPTGPGRWGLSSCSPLSQNPDLDSKQRGNALLNALKHCAIH